MRPARHPLGRKSGLTNTADLANERATEAGFSPFAAARMEFNHGCAFVSEWIPDQGEREALKSGARLRIITLGKAQIPLRVGVATSLPEDTKDATNPSRVEAVAKHLVEDYGGEAWTEVSAEDRRVAMTTAREIIQIVFGVFA